MNARQRLIVEVPFVLPQGVIVHPVVILSSNEAIETENAFVGVMLTTEKTYNDEFSFIITNEMTTKPLNVPFCQARLHLISFFREKDLILNKNTNNYLKLPYFKMLVKQISEITFGISE